MCLPVGFLKAYNGVGSAITILVGLFGIIYSLILVINDKGKFGIDNDSRDRICWAIFGSSFIILAFGILALVGIMKKKNALIVSYNVVVIFAMITFFGIAIASSIVPFKILNQSCSLPLNQQEDWSQNLQNMAMAANSTFCQQTCPCQISLKVFANYEPAYQMNMAAYLPYMSLNNTRFAQTYKQCPGINFDEDQQQSYDTLQSIQQTFGCAGWCNSSITYYFNPVLYGGSNEFNSMPQQTCYTALSSYYQKWGKKLVWAAWIIFVFMFLNGTAILCYVFHPQKKAGSMYQRLAG